MSSLTNTDNEPVLFLNAYIHPEYEPILFRTDLEEELLLLFKTLKGNPKAIEQTMNQAMEDIGLKANLVHIEVSTSLKSNFVTGKKA
jgi:hypothetical protein